LYEWLLQSRTEVTDPSQLADTVKQELSHHEYASAMKWKLSIHRTELLFRDKAGEIEMIYQMVAFTLER